MLAALRSGSFVTRQRMRVYSVLLLAGLRRDRRRAAGDGRMASSMRRGGRSARTSPTSMRPASWRSRASRRRPTTGRPTTRCRSASPAARTSATSAGTTRRRSCWSRRCWRRCRISAPCSSTRPRRSPPTWAWCGASPGAPRPGCWRWLSPAYSSTSRTATTASSPPRCWAARCWCSTAGRCWRGRCSAASPTSRSSGCWCRWCSPPRDAGVRSPPRRQRCWPSPG